MQQPSFDLSQPPAVQRRRGRPPGAKNRRSLDLAKYVEAHYGGLTPGQQSAEIALVKPADLKRARQLAKDLKIVDLDLPPMMLAMVVKAIQLAAALGCEPKEAWLLLAKERADLMAYVHQKQPQAADAGQAKAMPVAFLIPEGRDTGALADFASQDTDDETLELIGVSPAALDEVANPKSDDEAQPQAPQGTPAT